MCEFLVDTVLCESCLAHQVPVFPFPCCCVSVSCARFLRVPDSRHGMHHGSRNLTCPSHPTWWREPVFAEIIHGSAVDRVGRAFKTDGGRVGCGNVLLGKLLRLLSRRWDHSLSQLVLVLGGGSERKPGLPSLVDTKAIGKPPTFSGDVDVNGQPEGMPWSQWSFVFRSYLGAFDPTATRLLRQVESNVEDPVVVDNTSMTEGRETTFDTIVVRACFDLQRKCTAGSQTSS